MSYGNNPLAFLVDTLFHLYAVALLLRLLLQWVRADFYNPFAQALVQITNPVLRPLRRVIPGVGGFDLATLVALIAVKALGLWLVALIIGRTLPLLSMFFLAFLQLADLVLLMFMITIIVQVIVSWVNPGAWNPMTSLLHQLNAPLLRPMQRVLPSMGGLDLAPLFVLIGLQFGRLLLRWLF